MIFFYVSIGLAMLTTIVAIFETSLSINQNQYTIRKKQIDSGKIILQKQNDIKFLQMLTDLKGTSLGSGQLICENLKNGYTNQLDSNYYIISKYSLLNNYTSGIPSSGQISINQFYGKSNAAPIDTTVSGNQGTSSASGKFGQVNKGIQAAADGTDFPAIGSWSDSSFTNSSGNASFTITGFASGASNLAANTPRFSIAGNNVGPSFSALTGYNVLSGGGLNINISSNTGSASANVGTRYTPNAFTGALNGSGGLTANFS